MIPAVGAGVPPPVAGEVSSFLPVTSDGSKSLVGRAGAVRNVRSPARTPPEKSPPRNLAVIASIAGSHRSSRRGPRSAP